MDFLNEMGKAFHSVGAATEKDLSPKDINILPQGKMLTKGRDVTKGRDLKKGKLPHQQSNPVSLETYPFMNA